MWDCRTSATAPLASAEEGDAADEASQLTTSIVPFIVTGYSVHS
jgi:hypothetical protein